MKRASLFLFLFFACNSCNSCDSCGRTPAADDAATAASDAATAPTAAPTPTMSATAPSTATTGAATSNAPQTACRAIARDLTLRSCNCPQGNKVGCCVFGAAPPEKAPPYVKCSRGRTDWPKLIEDQLCQDAEKNAPAIAACDAARAKAACNKSAKDDLGLLLPSECEALFKALK